MLDVPIIYSFSLLSSIPLQGFPGRSAGKESACNAGDPSLIPEYERSTGDGIGYPLQYSWASLEAHLVKNLPAMQETWLGRSPGEGFHCIDGLHLVHLFIH